jgi:hypothetical protein
MAFFDKLKWLNFQEVEDQKHVVSPLKNEKLALEHFFPSV